MKKNFLKAISFLLVLVLIFSVATVGVAAEEKTAEKALSELDKNIPIIEIPGFGDQPIYSGISTETEDDDVDVWSFPVDKLVGLILKHTPDLIYSMMFGKFERIDVILTDVLGVIFGTIACGNDGVPSPDTGFKYRETVVKKDEYGKNNSYYFAYDWRLDMHTISTQLDEFVNEVLEVTGAEEVGLVSFSMGGAVMLTYLYEHYYIASAEDRAKIHSAIFLSGAMNGVECCGDPFSGNIVFDSKSLISLLCDTVSANEGTAWLSDMFVVIYALKILEPLISFTNETLVPNLGIMGDSAVTSTIGTVPAFYGLMSSERYYQTEKFLFDSPENKEKFSVLLEKSRYYHDNVQANKDEIIASFIADGKNFAVISEYGFPMLPVTSDNDRMSDGMIGTYNTSFGATCAEIDGTLGENYVQKVQCKCGKNHISPDNQIDASTCKYADITWFAKNVKHSCANRYFENLVDLVTYSDSQINVWTYPDIPQFMINQLDLQLVPMNAANAGKVVPFDETTILGKFFKDLF